MTTNELKKDVVRRLLTIGAFLFVWFLEKNKHLLNQEGKIKINDNALTAIALLVAQSNPNEKDIMIKLICNLIR